MRMKSCKEGVNDGREVKRDKEGKGAKKYLFKIFIEENVKEGNGVRMGEGGNCWKRGNYVKRERSPFEDK